MDAQSAHLTPTQRVNDVDDGRSAAPTAGRGDAWGVDPIGVATRRSGCVARWGEDPRGLRPAHLPVLAVLFAPLVNALSTEFVASVLTTHGRGPPRLPKRASDLVRWWRGRDLNPRPSGTRSARGSVGVGGSA